MACGQRKLFEARMVGVVCKLVVKQIFAAQNKQIIYIYVGTLTINYNCRARGPKVWWWWW